MSNLFQTDEMGNVIISESIQDDYVPDDNEILAEQAEGLAQDALVYRPSHYTQFAIEPIEFIMRNGLGFAQGNIVKYTLRAGSKLYPGKTAEESEIIDLEKVRRYAEMRINQIKGKDVL